MSGLERRQRHRGRSPSQLHSREVLRRLRKAETLLYYERELAKATLAEPTRPWVCNCGAAFASLAELDEHAYTNGGLQHGDSALCATCGGTGAVPTYYIPIGPPVQGPCPDCS